MDSAGDSCAGSKGIPHSGLVRHGDDCMGGYTEETAYSAYSSFSNTGSRYNPSSSSWSATSIGANVPGARYYHTAVWTGTEMIVWGDLA